MLLSCQIHVNIQHSLSLISLIVCATESLDFICLLSSSTLKCDILPLYLTAFLEYSLYAITPFSTSFTSVNLNIYLSNDFKLFSDSSNCFLKFLISLNFTQIPVVSFFSKIPNLLKSHSSWSNGCSWFF